MKRIGVVALTGRSGSGKSFAANYLISKGIPVVDGDAVAREVVLPGTDCLKEISNAFGKDILNLDGTLKRRELADRCFSDPEKKKLLEEIIFPHILARMEDYFEEYLGKGYRYCIVEAPALIESGLDKRSDRIVLITASKECQIDRIVERDSLTREQAIARITAQKNENEIRRIADFEIVNNGTKEELIAKLDELITKLELWFQ